MALQLVIACKLFSFAGADDSTLSMLHGYIDLTKRKKMEEDQEEDDPGDKVRLMTLHALKVRLEIEHSL